MKIKEFSIIRYGPLSNTGRILLDNFNLFSGKNEDGKTLTIDALVKMLFKKGRKVFEWLDRVEEEPEGYLVLQKGDKEIKLSEKGDLTKTTKLGAYEFRNIFIIRDSNLSILQEGGFYGNVTDRLTGLRTEEISDIKKKLQELGKLTKPDSSASLSNAASAENIKSRLETAKVLAKIIRALEKKAEKEGFDGLGQEIQKIIETIGEIQQRLNRLSDAQKREKYEKGIMALETFKSSLEALNTLGIYNKEDKQLWRDCERDIKNFKEDETELISELVEHKGQIQEKEKELDGKKRGFQILRERKGELDDEIKQDIKSYEMKSEEFASQGSKSKFFTSIIIISAILLGISLVGIIIRPSLLFYILAILLSISVAIFGILKFRLVGNKAWLARIFKKIKLATSKFALDAKNIEGILFNIQKFDEEYSQKESNLRDSEKEVSILREKIRKLKEKGIPEAESRIRDAKKEIDAVGRKSGVETLQEYNEKFELKQKHEESKRKQVGILESHFGSKGETLERKFVYWSEKIKDLKEYKDKAKQTKYSEKAVSELESEGELLEQKRQGIKKTLYSFYQELEEIERKANEILRLEGDFLHCQTLVDLDAIRHELQDFINGNENNKENALGAMRIFEEIEKAEKAKISELFGKDSSVSKYFNEITNGLYEEVMFSQETERIEIKRKDGTVLGAEKLSGGACDQLYLSIRLSLGERLLRGGKGFFIMDDPFIKADSNRLQRQIEMLKKISDSGWQILYFTAKDEVKHALKKDIESNKVHHIEISGISL